MDNQKKDQKTEETTSSTNAYNFGELKEFNLEQIESEVLFDKVYLDVFAGSDIRFKKNITPIVDALEKVIGLDSVNYEWSSETAPAGTQAGLLAQQVATVMPELVKTDTATGLVKVNYMQLSAYLVGAIKEMDARIRQLEARA